MTVPTLLLNDGNRIPQIGLGTWPLKDDEAATTVVAGIAAGYRHIDTAYRYGNETGVGRSIRASGIPRDEIFVTTKLDGEFQGGDRAVDGLHESLRRLGLDYVDLLLIHWPLPQRNEIRFHLEDVREAGRGRQGPINRGVQLQAHASRAPAGRSHDPARGQPDSVEPAHYTARASRLR